MYLTKIFKIFGALLFIIAVAGCGSEGNSNTNGTISLTADATPNGGGVVNLTATATLTPGQTGSKIHFTATMYDSTGIIEGPVSADIATNPAGVTSPFAFNFSQSTTSVTTLEVTATAGGLFDIKRISIPKFVPAP